MSDMAEFWYIQHYQDQISPYFNREQKLDIAQRISELTMSAPIWQDKNTDFIDQFTELKPHINVELSGLYLVTIMKGIVAELKCG